MTESAKPREEPRSSPNQPAHNAHHSQPVIASRSGDSPASVPAQAEPKQSIAPAHSGRPSLTRRALSMITFRSERLSDSQGPHMPSTPHLPAAPAAPASPTVVSPGSLLSPQSRSYVNLRSSRLTAGPLRPAPITSSHSHELGTTNDVYSPLPQPLHSSRQLPSATSFSSASRGAFFYYPPNDIQEIEPGTDLMAGSNEQNENTAHGTVPVGRVNTRRKVSSYQRTYSSTSVQAHGCSSNSPQHSALNIERSISFASISHTTHRHPELHSRDGQSRLETPLEDAEEANTISRVRHLTSRAASSIKSVDADEDLDGDVAAEKINQSRRFYDDFTTIDWVRDTINSSARRKFIRELPGIRGRLIRLSDNAQGWFLIVIIALSFSSLVFLFDKVEEYLFGLKTGICTTNIFHDKKACCMGFDPIENTSSFAGSYDACPAFRSWTSLLTDKNNWAGSIISRVTTDHRIVGFSVYTLFTILFATISCTLTLLSKTSTFVSQESKFLEKGIDPTIDHETAGLLSEHNSQTQLDTPKLPLTHSRIIYAAAGSGVPEVKTILSGFVIRGFLGIKTLFLKSVGLVFSIASGLAVGKEGPFVHLATCVGNVSCRLFNKYSENDLKRRQILAAASSAGVALAFGSPIGGVLFTLEEISYYFLPHHLFRIFFCALLSALFLLFWNPYNRGTIVLFEIFYNTDWMMWELFSFLFIGICGGIYGGLFCKFSGRWWPQHFRAFKVIKNHPRLEVIIIAVVTAILTYHNNYTRSAVAELLLALASPCQHDLGTSSINSTTTQPSIAIFGPSSLYSSFIPPIQSSSISSTTLLNVLGTSKKLCPTNFDELPDVVYPLLYALIVKVFLTAITFGLKVPAGIYVPTMVVGALFGRIFGILLQYAGHHWSQFFIDIGLETVTSSTSTNGSGAFITAALEASNAVTKIIPGTYAMAGAGAFMAGVTRMNLTLAVILFEITGSLRYVMPFSIAILVANWVSNIIEPQSLYEMLIESNDFPFLDNRVTLSFDSSLVDIMTRVVPDYVIDISKGAYITARQLLDILHKLEAQGEVDGCVPIVKGGTLFGMIPATELEFALDKIREQCIAAYAYGLERINRYPLPRVIEDQDAYDWALQKFESVLCKISVKDTDVSKYHRYYYSSLMIPDRNDEEEQLGTLDPLENFPGSELNDIDDEYYSQCNRASDNNFTSGKDEDSRSLCRETTHRRVDPQHDVTEMASGQDDDDESSADGVALMPGIELDARDGGPPVIRTNSKTMGLPQRRGFPSVHSNEPGISGTTEGGLPVLLVSGSPRNNPMSADNTLINNPSTASIAKTCKSSWGSRESRLSVAKARYRHAHGSVILGTSIRNFVSHHNLQKRVPTLSRHLPPDVSAAIEELFEPVDPNTTSDASAYLRPIASHSSAVSMSSCTSSGTSEPSIHTSATPPEDEILISDLTPYIDRAPIIMDVHSPLALVQMFFIKLGVRAVAVLEDGEFVGVLHKKKFIDFCRTVKDVHH